MTGRPAAQIDWKQVDKYLEAGANGVQIAARLGVAPDTLYIHCSQEHKMTFSAYAQEKKASGDALLHAAQFNKALKGDAGMLKWLGEFRLGQKSTNLDEITKASKDGVIDAVREIQGIGAGTPTFGESNVETQQPILDQGPSREADQVSNELGSEGAL